MVVTKAREASSNVGEFGSDFLEEQSSFEGTDEPADPGLTFGSFDELIAAAEADPLRHHPAALYAAVQETFRFPGLIPSDQYERLTNVSVALHERAFGKIHYGLGSILRITELLEDQAFVLRHLHCPYTVPANSSVLPYPYVAPPYKDIIFNDGRAVVVYGAPWELWRRSIATYVALQLAHLIRFLDQRTCQLTELGGRLHDRVLAGAVKVVPGFTEKWF